ncbi:MAG: lamin tail domain-containing protein [Akkermansiaceae bacterium]
MNRKIFAAICSCLVALLSGQVVINEIVADNFSSDFKDKRGTTPDWIELHNQGPTEINLFDYYLTDASEELTKWKFTENFVIPPGGHAIVFASDQDEFFEGEAHTNFRLGASGEYLALVAPDGETIVDAFSPEFPALKMLQSFGRPDDVAAADLLDQPTPGAANSPAAVRPQIVSFNSSVESIAWGESATLSWNVEDSDTIWLQSSISGDYNYYRLHNLEKNTGSITVSPNVTTFYRLLVSNKLIDTVEALEVNVAPGISALNAKPLTLVPGGTTVIRGETHGSSFLTVDDGFNSRFESINDYPSSFTYSPWNSLLLEKESTWKSLAGFLPEGWTVPDFDVDAWAQASGPFSTTENLALRKSFNITDPAQYRGMALRIAGRPDEIHLNGQSLELPYFSNAQTEEGLSYVSLKIPEGLLLAGQNHLAVFINEWNNRNRVVDLAITAWELQAESQTHVVEFVSTNEAGEDRETIAFEILANEEDAPPRADLVISEFYWHYYGAADPSAHRFIELHNREEENLVISEYQMIGNHSVDFALATPNVIEADSYALVVTDPTTFTQCWPGDRPIITTFGPGTDSLFDLNLSLLDPYGREFENIQEGYPEVDYAVPRQRLDETAPPLIPGNFAPIHDHDFCGGSPGEANFRFVSLTFDPPVAFPGEEVTLRWETSRDVTLSISGVGPVNSHVGEHRFTMRSDGRYSQTINFAAELTYDTRSISTEINPAAVIHDLQANPAIISPGQEVTFRWNVFGGNYPFTLSDDQGFTVDVSATQFAHIPQNVQPGEQRTYTLSITDERGTTSAQISVLFGDQGINFAAWEQENDLPAEDGDSDGLDNFLEYALGSDPRIQTDPPLTLTRDDAGFLNLHHPQNLVAEGAQLILETSFDLVSWNPIFSNLPVSSNFRLVERKLPPGSLISTNHYQNLIPTPLKNHYFRIRAKEPE